MKFQSKVFNEFDNIDWETVAPGMKRKIMGYDDNIMLVYVHFEKGGIGARHKHPHSQTTFIVSGEFEVTVGDEAKVLKRMMFFTFLQKLSIVLFA